jgi:acetolactate synthase-1/3 small subunit
VADTAALFATRMIDLSPKSMTFEISGTPEHLASFLEHVRPYGIIELVKSGRVALKKQSDVSTSLIGGGTR